MASTGPDRDVEAEAALQMIGELSRLLAGINPSNADHTGSVIEYVLDQLSQLVPILDLHGESDRAELLRETLHAASPAGLECGCDQCTLIADLRRVAA